MGRTLKWITEALHRRIHHNVKVTAEWLGKVVDGWLNYFAVPNSYRYLERFANCVRRLWLRSLRRRSQKDRTTWADIAALTAAHWPRLEVMVYDAGHADGGTKAIANRLLRMGRSIREHTGGGGGHLPVDRLR